MNGTIPPDSVRQLAYQLWEQRGCQGGSPEEDWFRAEEILSSQQNPMDEARVAEATASGSAPTTPNSDARPLKTSEKMDHAVDESFPASDPPAVHTKDEPPVNAGAKWKAAKSAGRNSRRNASP